jgi:riboflavin transporter FmnP
VRVLLVIKAAVEAATGIALVLAPSLVLSFLLGAPLDAPVGKVVCRIAGAALLTIGIACWFARNDTRSRATIGLIEATLLYDFAVAVILLVARLDMGLSGIALWPAVAFYLGLAITSLVYVGKAFRT